MQVSVETVSNIERRITVEVPAERIDPAIQQRLQQTARSARIDGFRPGKVPLKVIQKRYGAGVRQEVINQVLQETLVDALKQSEQAAVGNPRIDITANKDGEALVYTATFEVFPEVELSDLAEISVEQQQADIQDSDIDSMIERLREQRKTYQDVGRKAKLDDQLVIDFNGTLDGEAFEGGSAEGHSLVLGSNAMIPGFEDGLVGTKAGEETVLDLTFPEEYHAEQLAGKAVQFAVTVKAVQESVLPELNSEFFSQFGVAEDAGEEEFRAEVRKNMGRELKDALRSKVKNQIVQALLAANEAELPSSIVEQEVKNLQQEMAQQFGGQMDPSTLPAELFTEQAENRVKTGLLINQYVKDNNIEQDDDSIRQLIEDTAAPYENPQAVIDSIYQNQDQLNQFRSLALEEKVIDHMLDVVKVETKTVSYEEALKPEQPQGEQDEAADTEA